MKPAHPAEPDATATLLRAKATGSLELSAAFALVATDGPLAGQRFVLDASLPSRVLLGQSAVCEVCIADAEVSRRHAAVDLSGGQLRITDLGSTNGTFVDGVRVLDAYLRAGQTLRVGASAFRIDAIASGQVAPLPTATSFGRLLGASVEMRRLYPLCERLAASNVPLVIEGETGTGKEVLAESIHEQGPRAAGPFVVFDCTAVPPNLMESELFGHERGAFTGAVSRRIGLFEQAHGGTLFIDEIGDLEPALQPKLLRALERSEVRRIGADKPTVVDARVIAATRRNLDHEVQAGRFRDDLFHRLVVTRVELPPLRARRSDVGMLARHFAALAGGPTAALSPDLVTRWEDENWPGNVRELKNAVAQQIALGDLAPSSRRAKEDPPPGIDFLDSVLREPLPLAAARQRVVDEFERRYVERVLERHGGNVTEAAAASGVARRYFHILRARRAR